LLIFHATPHAKIAGHRKACGVGSQKIVMSRAFFVIEIRLFTQLALQKHPIIFIS